jgi:NADH-quinone oxidoreductase subunit M
VEFPYLSLITWLPLAGGILVLCLGKRREQAARWVALGVSGIVFLTALSLWGRFDPEGGMQFVERHEWVPTLGVFYHLGVDGLSVTMVLLTAIITPVAILASSNIKERQNLYFFLFLLLETGMLGVFTALNFFHFFLFWESSLVPMFFLIKMWGGKNRDYAAFKFFVYTMAGSIAMLLVFQFIFLATNYVFEFPELARLAGEPGGLPGLISVWFQERGVVVGARTVGIIAFCAISLAFAIKVPVWPFHTWLPDAHTEAPTAGSIVLAGVLLKMGVYGFLRVVLPFFPETSVIMAPVMAYLAVASVIFGAFAAMSQSDVKRMIAYSSVNHMGYCMMGITAVVMSSDPGLHFNARVSALNGTILQMFNHGITAGALFLLVGMIYDRAHTRNLDDFGGLRKIMPVFAGLMGIATFSSIGLPGLNGFVSEFMIFRGAFALLPGMTVLATIGLVVTAVYLLLMMQKIFHGPVNPRWNELEDLKPSEIVNAAPLIFFMFYIGVYPRPLIEATNYAVVKLVELFG